MFFHLSGPTAYLVKWRILGCGLGIVIGVGGLLCFMFPAIRRDVLDRLTSLNNSWLRLIGIGFLSASYLFRMASLELSLLESNHIGPANSGYIIEPEFFLYIYNAAAGGMMVLFAAVGLLALMRPHLFRNLLVSLRDLLPQFVLGTILIAVGVLMCLALASPAGDLVEYGDLAFCLGIVAFLVGLTCLIFRKTRRKLLERQIIVRDRGLRTLGGGFLVIAFLFQTALVKVSMPMSLDGFSRVYDAAVAGMMYLLFGVGMLSLLWPCDFRILLARMKSPFPQFLVGLILMAVGGMMCFYLSGTDSLLQYRTLDFGLGIASLAGGLACFVFSRSRRNLVERMLVLRSPGLRVIGIGFLAAAYLFSMASLRFTIFYGAVM